MNFVKESVKRIEAKIDDISKDSFWKANLYDKQKEMLSLVRFELNKVSPTFLSENGTYCIKVEYKIPPIMLYFDGNGELISNDRFKAINALDLISYNDMEILRNKIAEIAKKNKNDVD